MKEESKIAEFLWLTLGSLLVAVGIYFFKYPNNFTTGGVSGLSVVLHAIFPHITAGDFVMGINILFLILGFLVLNKGFGAKTVYCSLLMSIAIRVLEAVCPLAHPLTDQKVLELLYSVILPAAGSAILFNRGGSTGGTDIAAMILKKFFSIDIGKALLISDCLIAASAIFFFGIETGLFSLMGLGAKAMLVDSLIESINLKKNMLIITKHPKEVSQYILKELHRGATIWQAYGAYTNSREYVVMTALNRAQAQKVRQYVKSVDPESFTVITNTSGILGKGFREVA